MPARTSARRGSIACSGARYDADSHDDVLTGQLRRGGPLAQLQACQSQVERLDRAALVPQQVGGLDVAVNDTRGVSVGQAAGRLQQAVHGLSDGQWSLALDDLFESAADDVFHHQEVAAALLGGIVGGDDVGMSQPGRRLRFALEAGPRRLRTQQLRGQHFSRHHTLHAAVPGHETRPMPPAAGRLQQDVIAEHQSVAAVAQQLLRLVRRQRLAFHQSAGQFQLPHQRLRYQHRQFLRRQQSASCQAFGKLGGVAIRAVLVRCRHQHLDPGRQFEQDPVLA